MFFFLEEGQNKNCRFFEIRANSLIQKNQKMKNKGVAVAAASFL